MRAGFSSPENHGYQKAVDDFLRTEGKGLLTHIFYIWQNYQDKEENKNTVSQQTQNLQLADLPLMNG